MILLKQKIKQNGENKTLKNFILFSKSSDLECYIGYYRFESYFPHKIFFMYYVIQNNIFKEINYNLLIEIMERHNLEHKVVRLEPVSKKLFELAGEDEPDIEAVIDRKDVFCFGSVPMAHIAKQFDWKPGSLMNENSDFEVYAKGFGYEHMLNGDFKTMKFCDPLVTDDFMFFMRPTKDTKLFTGQVFTANSWLELQQDCISKKLRRVVAENPTIMVSSLKDTQQEVRCWVVKGKVITASRYKIGNRVSYQNYDSETFYVDFAQKMASKYQPADAFVLDVCLVNDELKIVEVNCINCAGFYHADMHKLISALEEGFK